MAVRTQGGFGDRFLQSLNICICKVGVYYGKEPNCISVPVQDGVGGGLFSYAHCCYDLQEFQLEAKPDDSDEEMKYKAGHSHVKTAHGYLMVQNTVALLSSGQ